MTAVTRSPLAALLLLAACNTGFDPQYRVLDVRVLAVRSGVTAGSSADVAPGETLVLRALVANPKARPGLGVTWFGCLPAADESLSPCADPDYLVDPARLVPLTAGPSPRVVLLGTGGEVSYAVPALTDAMAFVVATAKARPTFECRLYAELVVVAVAEAEGVRSVAVKRVRVKPPAALVTAEGVTDRYALNLNPEALDVRRAPSDEATCAGGTSVATGAFPAGRTVVCGRASGTSTQQFAVCEPAGGIAAASERLDWQWYVTGGEFPEEGGVGNARGVSVDFERPSGPFTLWAIVRDGRGGDDWVTFLVSTL